MSRRAIRRKNQGSSITEKVRDTYRTQLKYNDSIHGIYTGQVESADDPNRIGRLLVHVPRLNKTSPDLPGERKNSDRESGFLWCHPILPFFGTNEWTPETKNDGDVQDGYSLAYGDWGPMPQIGDTVAVAFLDGGTPVWIGCIPKARKNFSMPGLPGDEVDGGEDIVPATDKSVTNEGLRKPIGPLADNIKQAGLINDKVRGPGTSGSTRESPSLVTGRKSRGYNGQPGHSFIMDDHPEQQGIRLRTSHGHQITFSDVTHSIYIATAKGNSWIEINEDGKIDLYAGDSISMHTTADLNVRVDGNYTLDVAGDMVMAVGGDLSVDVKGNTDEVIGGYFKTTVSRNYEVKTEQAYKLASGDTLDIVGGSDTTYASRSALNIYGQGLVAIDSGVEVRSEEDIASLPSFNASTDVVQSTLGNLNLDTADVGPLASSVSVTSMVNEVDATSVTNILSGSGSTGLSLPSLSGATSSLLTSGLDINSISGTINDVVANISNISDGLMSQLEGFGLSTSDLDFSSLGFEGVLGNLSDAGLPSDTLDTLLGSHIAGDLPNIAANSGAMSSITSRLGNIDLNLFRENLTSLNSGLSAEAAADIDPPRRAAIAAIMSRNTSLVSNLPERVNQLHTVLENPSATIQDNIRNVRLDPGSVSISEGGFDNMLSQFNLRGLTLSNAQSIFGEQYGADILTLFDAQPDIDSLTSAFNVLDNNGQFDNLLGSLSAGFQTDLTNITSVLPSMNIDNLELGDLSSTLNNALQNPASAVGTKSTTLPGAPSPTEISTGSVSNTSDYVSPRVPQHEPWEVEGRIITEQTRTEAPGNIKKSTGTNTNTGSSSGVGPSMPRQTQEGTTAPDSELEDDEIRYLVVHCSATTANQRDQRDTSKVYDHTSVEYYHTRTNGWSSIGYHYVINRDGSVINTLPLDQRGGHVLGFNSISLGICLIGGLADDGETPEANFTQRQFAAARSLLTRLSGQYPNAEIVGHRYFNGRGPGGPKACPSFDVPTWWNENRIVNEVI